MVSPAEHTGSSVTCPVLAPPTTESLGLTRAGGPGAGYAAVRVGRVTWGDPLGSRQGPQTVPQQGSAAARGAPWSWSTRGPTMKAGAGGRWRSESGGAARAGFSSPREGAVEGGEGQSAPPRPRHSSAPAPSCTAQLTHTLPLRTKCVSKGKRPQVSL